MKSNHNEITEFFPSSNLNNISFFLYCPSMNEEEKEEISNTILKNKGVSNILFNIFLKIELYLFIKAKCNSSNRRFQFLRKYK